MVVKQRGFAFREFGIKPVKSYNSPPPPPPLPPMQNAGKIRR